MPAYEYRCQMCGLAFESHHGMNENPAMFCPECGAPAVKMISGGTGFIMKASRQTDAIIQCGREETCCGRRTPCETRPCGT